MDKIMSWKWLAGFIDGEGSIGISKSKGNMRHDLRVSIGQKHKKVLSKIKSFVGTGTIRNYSSGFLYDCFCRQAECLLKNVLPYLLVKRMQAQYALQYMRYKELFAVKNSKSRISKKELRWREMHRQLISKLNRR